MEEEKNSIKDKIKNSGHKLGKEFKKSINTAIVAAFSLIVALAWKDVVTEYVDKVKSMTSINGALISALFITLISVFGILLVSRILGSEEK